MEKVLNQNQRKSALWRLLSVSVFILSLVGTILFSLFNNHDEGSVSILEDLRNQYDSNQNEYKAMRNDYKKEMDSLEKELNDCKKGQNTGKEKQLIKEEMEGVKEQIKDKEGELTRCQSNLIAKSSSQNDS